MEKDKRKILVIGKTRIPLPSLSTVRGFLRRKIQIANRDIPVLWILIVVVAVIAVIALISFISSRQAPVPVDDRLGGSAAAGAVDGGSAGGEIAPTVPAANPNRGKFIIEKIDANTMQPIANGSVGIEVSSEDTGLADAVKEKTAGGTLQTDAQGQVVLELPALPWAGGQNLTLTITESPTSAHIGMQPFSVVIEPQNGTVISVLPAPGDQKRVKAAFDSYGVSAVSQPVVTDYNFYDAALRTWIKKVDRISGDETTTVFYDENPNISEITVENGDIVLVRVDAYNQCLNTVIIPEITAWIPSGLIFDPAQTIAHIDPAQPAYTNNDWELASSGSGQPDKLRFKGEPIRIDPWNGKDNIYPEKRYAIALKVDTSRIPADAGGKVTLSGIAEILRLQNGDGQDVEDADSAPDGLPFNEGAVSDNNIEEHQKGASGQKNYAKDEDDHDIASLIVNLPVTAPAVSTGEAGADSADDTDGTKPAAQEQSGFELWMLIPIIIAIAALAVCVWRLYGQPGRKREQVSRRRRKRI